MKISPDYIPEELENLSIEDVPDIIDSVALDTKDTSTPLASKMSDLNSKNTYVEMLSGETYVGKLDVRFDHFYVGNSDSLALSEVKYLLKMVLMKAHLKCPKNAMLSTINSLVMHKLTVMLCALRALMMKKIIVHNSMMATNKS